MQPDSSVRAQEERRGGQDRKRRQSADEGENDPRSTTDIDDEDRDEGLNEAKHHRRQTLDLRRGSQH
jgi:hypothetical protein